MQERSDPELRPLGPATLHLPHATSLRMSDLGYRNRNQSAVSVSVNALSEYLRDISSATHTVHPPFAALGVRVDGEYRQLNANILQIENEYYSNIRPKRAPRELESTGRALARAGVEYVEFRALDLCVFEPIGICADEMYFMEAFAALCLLRGSEPLGASEQEQADRNHLLVARRGREPGLKLEREGRAVPLKDWAASLLDELAGICELLDAGQAARPYSQTLLRQRDKLADAALTPSARLLRELHSAGAGHAEYTCHLSAQHRARLLEPAGHEPLVLAAFAAEAAGSLEEQERLEAADRGSFEDYLARALGPGFA
jgi:glutamate--cysteine ligase